MNSPAGATAATRKGKNDNESAGSSAAADTLPKNAYLYMALAAFLSTRSPDQERKVGSLLVKDGLVAGQGYNAMVRGSCTEDYPLSPHEEPLLNKNKYVVHAEINSFLYCGRDPAKEVDFSNYTMYVTTHPCNHCAKYVDYHMYSEKEREAQGTESVRIYYVDKQRSESKKGAGELLLQSKVRKIDDGFKRGYILDFDECTFSQVEGGKTFPSWPPACATTFGVDIVGFTDELSTINREIEEMKNSPDKLEKKKNERKAGWEKWSKARLPWPDFFFAICIMEAQESDVNNKQGACVVDAHNCIVACGKDTVNPSHRDKVNVTHAVESAIIKAGARARGAVLYTLNYPCNDCAKVIIQFGIKKVMYMREMPEDDKYRVAKRMLDQTLARPASCSPALCKYEPPHKKLRMEFNAKFDENRPGA